MEEYVARFAALFKGNTRSFGLYFPKRAGAQRMKTEKKAPQTKNFQDHLAGKTGIGVVPITDDGTCYFGVIDIDAHDDGDEIDISAVEAKVRAMELPLTVCRSKSGGAHAYLFGEEPLRAALVRSILSKWANDLGHPGVEVFPKQSYLRSDSSGARALGNWINLPYFNHENTDRYALEEGEPATLDFFLTNAEVRRVSQNELEELYSTEHPEAPPCIQRMLAGGIPSGYRNEALYNLTVYLKRAFPDDYRDRAFDLNNRLWEPLSHNEAKKTINSASRREYKYKCSEEPINGLCDSKTCLERKFGISKSDADDLAMMDSLPDFTDLKKYLTDPVRWEIKVDGVPIIVPTATIMSFGKMREAIADKLTRLVPTISNKNWQKMLGALMETCQLEEAPDDASTAGLMRSALVDFIQKADLDDDGTDTKKRPLLRNGVPVVQERDGERVVYFRANDFVQHLKRTRSEELKGVNLYFALKQELKLGHGRLNLGGGDCIQVWYVPIDDQQRPQIDVPDYETEF